MCIRDRESMITSFNTVVTETASEIRGKHRQQRKPWSLQIFLICATKGENLERKKRFEPEVSEKQKESEVEENLRKTNSKRAYLLVKDLTTCELLLSKIIQGIASQKSDRY